MSDQSVTALTGVPEPFGAAILQFRKYRYWTSVTFLVSADIFVFFLAAVLFSALASTLPLLPLPGSFRPFGPVNAFLPIAGLFILVRGVLGDYGRRWLFWDEVRAMTISVLLAGVPILLLLAAFEGRNAAYAGLACAVFLVVALPVTRYGARKALGAFGIWRLPTVLIADGAEIGKVYKTISETVSLGFDIRGLILNHAQEQLPGKIGTLKPMVMTDAAEIAGWVGGHGSRNAVIATGDMHSKRFLELVQKLMEKQVSVSFIPLCSSLPLAGMSRSYFFRGNVAMFHLRDGLTNLPGQMLKRAFDIFGSAALLLVLSPIFLIISLIVKLHDGGSVFYAQRRVGQNGREFGCMKFRSMAPDADARRSRWQAENPELYQEFLKSYKLRDDPRITRPGKWLRRSSIDELPQLLNVLRGEMSLVGPRPIPEQQLVDHYGEAAQLYMQVRPGITGLWQISGRNETTLDERVSLDEWYILNRSFWFDIVILVETARIVLSGRGAF